MSKQSNSEAGETAQSSSHDLNLTKADPRVQGVLENRQSTHAYLLMVRVQEGLSNLEKVLLELRSWVQKVRQAQGNSRHPQSHV